MAPEPKQSQTDPTTEVLKPPTKKKTPKKLDTPTKVDSKKIGRPTKYEGQKTIDKFVQLVNMGLGYQQIADSLDINIDTIYEWFLKHKDFSEVVKQAKDNYDIVGVEKSLLKSAYGFTRKVQKLGKNDNIITLEEEVPPNPTSLIFWLSNRNRSRWKQRQEVEHSGEIKHIAVTVNAKVPQQKQLENIPIEIETDATDDAE